MAELELTKIENGMANGGTAIGANFDAAKDAIDASTAATQVHTKSVAVPASGGFTATTFYFTRQGDLCIINGFIYTTATVNTEIFPSTSFPVGFVPTDASQVNAALVSILGGTQKLSLHMNGNGGLTVMTASGATSDRANFTAFYKTNDDFPS